MMEYLSDSEQDRGRDRLTRLGEAIVRFTKHWYVPGCAIGFPPFFCAPQIPDDYSRTDEYELDSSRRDAILDRTEGKAYVNRQIRRLEKHFSRQI